MQTRVVRYGYLVFGLANVGLGYIGAVTPLMPSTIFFIIALWAFKRSSPKLEGWLLNHSIFGSTLREWEEHKAIRPAVKRIAVGMLWLSLGVSSLFMKHWYGYAILAATGICVTWFIATRPSVTGVNLESATELSGSRPWPNELSGGPGAPTTVVEPSSAGS